MRLPSLLTFTLVASLAHSVSAGEPLRDTSRGDKMIAEYFRAETTRITRNCLADIKTKADWLAKRSKYHRQLRDMLGLDPWPTRTPLKAEITGNSDHKEFTVENVQFQSLPGLYVTGNLYVPKERKGKLPTVLYVCGHGRKKIDGVSYGNKTSYQHHGGWFARNGYVCLTIDTIQLGEIEGIHHGTYRHGMWWWNARGYTPAGVEAWNSIRALDYLETRPEVDATRMGVTGRSGGGAYSWWTAALDDRIKAAVPVAGITSLHNHVVDGCIEGHCDCMYMLNTYEWDFPLLAALVAPRPLLISNTDKDGIFPLDGVVDVYAKTRRIYELLGARRHIGLHITEGPHKDTQNLRVHAFDWFNKFLKGQDPTPLIETAARPLFTPQQLKVFKELPADERVTKIHETFVPAADKPQVPKATGEWKQMRESAMTALKEKVFRGWPTESGSSDESLYLKEVGTQTNGGIKLTQYEFTSQDNIRLPLFLAHRDTLKPDSLDLLVLNVLDEGGWAEFLESYRVEFPEVVKSKLPTKVNAEGFKQLQGMFKSFKWGMAYLPTRGVGPTAWNQSERKQTHIRRRHLLLGQTLDGMRVWDAIRGAQALRTIEGINSVPLWLQGQGDAAGIALYAGVFVPKVKRMDLHGLPASHRDGPVFLNISRHLDIPFTLAMAAEKSQVIVYDLAGAQPRAYPHSVGKALGWKSKAFQVRKASDSTSP